MQGERTYPWHPPMILYDQHDTDSIGGMPQQRVPPAHRQKRVKVLLPIPRLRPRRSADGRQTDKRSVIVRAISRRGFPGALPVDVRVYPARSNHALGFPRDRSASSPQITTSHSAHRTGTPRPTVGSAVKPRSPGGSRGARPAL